MTAQTVFVGDVHGSLQALQGLIRVLSDEGNPHAVFLGDYIDKGSDSPAVMEELVDYSAQGHATLLRGNHESALIDALDSGDLKGFLRLGGAMTIRSYVGRKVRPDVLDDFRSSLPERHVEVLRGMPEVYEGDDVIARHVPLELASAKFAVSAHSFVGPLPRIGRNSARLDTGCGVDSGRLTAFFWPSRKYVQVDMQGVRLTT